MKRNIIVAMIFVIGLSIFSYPLVSNLLVVRTNAKITSDYDKQIDKVRSKDLENEEEHAKQYNEILKKQQLSIIDPFEEQNKKAKQSKDDGYYELLNIGKTMGYVEIPKINVKTPIYHGTSEDVLSKGIGHLEGTSLPIGGKGNHTVITGHRGLPSAKLFTDLPKLKEGDEFYLKHHKKILAYEIDQIKVVLPNETEELRRIEGKDLATLITCTPYGVNSHRLLVRGHRVPYNGNKDEVNHDAELQDSFILFILLGLIISILIYLIKTIKKKKKYKS